jgi:hypothetical protein
VLRVVSADIQDGHGCMPRLCVCVCGGGGVVLGECNLSVGQLVGLFNDLQAVCGGVCCCLHLACALVVCRVCCVDWMY